jgi:enterochelin esterase-like enzyme
MKKIISFFLLLSISSIAISQGKTMESLIIQSKVLGKDVRYSIYLPSDYETSQRKYPVLYLLHGYSDDETGWTQFGEVQKIANESISKGEATQMIIVMPDAGVSWYINDAAGKVKYEDFFINEFIPFIDSIYKTRNKKQYRAVAGLSMGGYGSFIYAMKHPDLFSAAAPLSAAIHSDYEITEMPDNLKNYKFIELFGIDLAVKNRLTETWNKNSVLKLAANVAVEKLNQVHYYIDCGDDDRLVKANMELHSIFLDRKVKHEFRVRDGAHNWPYWRSALPEVLKFISESFHR